MAPARPRDYPLAGVTWGAADAPDSSSGGSPSDSRWAVSASHWPESSVVLSDERGEAI